MDQNFDTFVRGFFIPLILLHFFDSEQRRKGEEEEERKTGEAVKRRSEKCNNFCQEDERTKM